MPLTQQDLERKLVRTICCFQDTKQEIKLEQSRINRRRKRSYAWTIQENYLYMSYLRTFSSELQIIEMAKYLKFFTRMAQLIKTRSSQQIKSHHQKMTLKYKTIQNIIKKILESEEGLEKIYSITEFLGNFLQKEKPAVTDLLCIFRSRMNDEGKMTSLINQKLTKIIPNLPNISSVKVEEEDMSYKFYEQNYECGLQSGAAVKREVF